MLPGHGCGAAVKLYRKDAAKSTINGRYEHRSDISCSRLLFEAVRIWSFGEVARISICIRIALSRH